MFKAPQLTTPGSARGRGKLAKSLIERDYASDTDRTRSASPPTSVYATTKKSTPNMRINTLLNDENGTASTPSSKRGTLTRPQPSRSARNFPAARSRLDAHTSQDGQSPITNNNPTFTGPHGFYLPLNGSDPSHKRTRPLTQHQLAVEQYRRRRVDVILDRGIRIEYKAAARRRKGANTLMRSWVRCKGMPDGYDTDEENNSLGFSNGNGDAESDRASLMPAGLVPLDFGGEVNDHGEESYYKAKMLSRALRRLDRWEGGKTVRMRGKEEVFEEGMDRRPVDEDSEDEGDEDMLDVEDEGVLLRREIEESSASSEEEEEEEVGGRYDKHTLPPLGRMV